MGMGEGRADTGRALVASTVGMSCVDSGRRHTGGVESDQGHHTLGKGGRQSLCAGDPTSWTTGTRGEGQHGKQPECRPQTQEWTKGQREGPAPRTMGATGGLVLRRLLRQGGVEPPGQGPASRGCRGGEGRARLVPCGCCQLPLRTSGLRVPPQRSLAPPQGSPI